MAVPVTEHKKKEIGMDKLAIERITQSIKKFDKRPIIDIVGNNKISIRIKCFIYITFPLFNNISGSNPSLHNLT